MKALRVALFTIIGVGLFLLVQYILTPDWSNIDNMAYTFSGFYALKEDAIDVVFLGTSHVEFGMSPMKIYEDTGICSYSLATSGQPLPVGYYTLKECFKRQSPSVVVLDVGKLFADGAHEDAEWRRLIDNLPLWPPNIELARDYDDQVADNDVLTALVPLVRYHSGWTNLPKKALGFKTGETYYSAGQFVYDTISPNGLSLEDMNAQAYANAAVRRETVKYIEDGTYHEGESSKTLYAPEIPEFAREWLIRIKELCGEHDAQLLLTKIPVRYNPIFYTGAWTEIKSNLVRSFADEIGVPFFDLVYDADCGIDFLKDTFDGGNHLNFLGAEKTAAVIGEYLQDNYDLESKDNDQFNAALKEYRKVREVVLLQTETNFERYIERLRKNMHRWTILISASDDYTINLNDENDDVFSDLGLKLLQEGVYHDAYIAAIENGNVLYEELSALPVSYTLRANEKTISMYSSGWDSTPKASIIVDGVECALNQRGLNIVVIDDETDQVIDSAAFDTFSESKQFSRNGGNTINFLRTYEAAVCFE